jgi:hypothetical protein
MDEEMETEGGEIQLRPQVKLDRHWPYFHETHSGLPNFDKEASVPSFMKIRQTVKSPLLGHRLRGVVCT